MYKVFVNDIPIILSTKKNIGENYSSFPIKNVNFEEIIEKINSGESLYVNLYHEKEKKLLKHLLKKLPVVTAAGGMVFNDNKEILFIYRNKRWDLPKGKMEKFCKNPKSFNKILRKHQTSFPKGIFNDPP